MFNNLGTIFTFFFFILKVELNFLLLHPHLPHLVTILVPLHELLGLLLL